ncbi:opsin, ultraviolet-sensitive-like [Neocloeon triangulifer]|uniref:opsin, ultraviolet-sensitive-like n=1 Tax=Neocloeon triangulifer TaxID=2078957 RepID=UPI00286EDE77|nr:opsin, ultraviolet-sensitive-like [Neocloeon triangulifer]
MAFPRSYLEPNLTNGLIRPEYRSDMKMMAWDVPLNAIDEIPKHWLTFPAPESYLHQIIAVIYVFFMIFSLVGNGMVIWIFGVSKSLRSASNMFVVNLAIADFGMMLKSPIVIYNSLYEGYALGKWGCQVFGIMGSYTGIVQATTNLCIAYDRYRNISNPMDGQMSKKKAFFFILLTWAYATPWTLMPFFEYWGRFVPEGYLTTCSFDFLTETIDNKLFVFFIFTFSYVFPMSFIIFFYSQIVSQVFNHEKALRKQAKKMNVESLRSGDKAAVSAEVRIAKTAISICGLFIASWTPYAVIAMIGAFGNQALITPTVSMIPALTCKIVACLDPYVYAISHPKYRLELQSRCACLNIKEEAPEKADTSAAAATVAA